MMRKFIIIVLSSGSAILFAWTIITMIQIFKYDVLAPDELNSEQVPSYRLVLITQELDTPFWNEVENGAQAAADEYGVELSVWGSYSRNSVDFLRKIEIAIASKVDGIIVQGLESEEFYKLTTVKAAGNGIPIFTIANDVSLEKSLRRTFIGSDHELAGKLIGQQLLIDIGAENNGKVVLMLTDKDDDYQKKRLAGILEELDKSEGIETVIVVAGNTREEIIAATNQVMNEEPMLDGFVSITANHTSAMIQEIGKRSRLSDFHLYSFDDSAENKTLLKERKLSGMIQQSPQSMGYISVELMVKWLKRDLFPVDNSGYFTELSLLKAEDL